MIASFSLLFVSIAAGRWPTRRCGGLGVTLNGEQVQLPEQIVFVADLLEFYNVQNKVVVVEVNGNILNKDEHQETRLSDRDKIEIVHFVGGG